MLQADENARHDSASAEGAEEMTARLWILSDLHEETDPGGLRRPRAPDCDIVVVAGDVYEGDPREFVERIARLADGRPAVAVLGNHDHYGLSLASAASVAQGLGAPLGVHVLEGSQIAVAGLVFAGGTLWDHVPAHQECPDLTAILKSAQPALFAPMPNAPCGEPIFQDEVGSDGAMRRRAATFADIADRRRATLAAIAAADADVVVTHHPPVPSDLSLAGRARLWIHGHNHVFRRDHHRDLEVVVNARQARIFADHLVIRLPRRAF